MTMALSAAFRVRATSSSFLKARTLRLPISTAPITTVSSSITGIGSTTAKEVNNGGGVAYFSSVSSPFQKDKSLHYITRKESKYTLGKHRSNALGLVKEQPIIEVDGDMAVCDGGGGALGHPLEYINVAKAGEEGVPCVYCGLRFRKKNASH